MALSDATRLADFATGVGTDGTLSANNINATGIVTATSFYGSGENLTGVSGFATALSSTAGEFLNIVFKTQKADTIVLYVMAEKAAKISFCFNLVQIESMVASGNSRFTRAVWILRICLTICYV